MVRLWQAPRSLGASRRVRESGFAANHPPKRIGVIRRTGFRWKIGPPNESRPVGDSARPANHPLQANRIRRDHRDRRGNRDPFRRFGPSRESPTSSESAPTRRICPLWQAGLPKDPRSAGESGPSGSSRAPRPTGIRSGESARPANHPLGTNRHPSGEPALGSWRLAPVRAARQARGRPWPALAP